jgi:hypothetical protein
MSCAEKEKNDLRFSSVRAIITVALQAGSRLFAVRRTFELTITTTATFTMLKTNGANGANGQTVRKQFAVHAVGQHEACSCYAKLLQGNRAASVRRITHWMRGVGLDL